LYYSRLVKNKNQTCFGECLIGECKKVITVEKGKADLAKKEHCSMQKLLKAIIIDVLSQSE